MLIFFIYYIKDKFNFNNMLTMHCYPLYYPLTLCFVFLHSSEWRPGDNYFLNQISKSYPYSTFHNTLSLFGSGSLFIHASVTETCCEEPFHHYELPSHHVINYAEKGVASELLAIVLLTIFHLPIKSDAGIVIISTSRL